MAIFVNPFKGGFKIAGVTMRRAGHVKRGLIKDLRGRSIKMYGESGRVIREEEDVKKAFKKHLAKKILKGEAEELTDIDKLIDDLREAMVDLAAIGQFVMESLVELIKEDERVRSRFPAIKGVEQQAIIQRKKLQQVLQDAGAMFYQEAGSS